MSDCDHVYQLGKRRFRCVRCNRPLNPWYVWAWEWTKMRWWIWRDRVDGMLGR